MKVTGITWDLGECASHLTAIDLELPYEVNVPCCLDRHQTEIWLYCTFGFSPKEFTIEN